MDDARERGHRVTRRILPLVALTLACGSVERADDAGAPELPLLALSGPTLEIGAERVDSESSGDSARWFPGWRHDPRSHG